MKTIFICLDSLNRHYISPYTPNAWVQTPNIQRLSDRGITFDNHFCGSMPCMPARREFYTGRINFLETPWSAFLLEFPNDHMIAAPAAWINHGVSPSPRGMSVPKY